MGFERIVLLSHTYDARNALLALPRLYKVYTENKRVLRNGNYVLVEVPVEVVDESDN